MISKSDKDYNPSVSKRPKYKNNDENYIKVYHIQIA